MDIRSNLMYGNVAVNEAYTAKASAAAAKESKLATGKKLSALSSDAASLQIKSKTGEVADAALENINAASSLAADVAKAEEMIREANRHHHGGFWHSLMIQCLHRQIRPLMQ